MSNIIVESDSQVASNYILDKVQPPMLIGNLREDIRLLVNLLGMLYSTTVLEQQISLQTNCKKRLTFVILKEVCSFVCFKIII